MFQEICWQAKENLGHGTVEIQRYNQNETKFNGDCSRNNFERKIKDGVYVINPDKFANIRTHQDAIYIKSDPLIYFSSFVAEHSQKEAKKFIGNRNIIANVFRIQAYNSLMFGYSCHRSIDFMLNNKSLT